MYFWTDYHLDSRLIIELLDNHRIPILNHRPQIRQNVQDCRGGRTRAARPFGVLGSPVQASVVIKLFHCGFSMIFAEIFDVISLWFRFDFPMISLPFRSGFLVIFLTRKALCGFQI